MKLSKQPWGDYEGHSVHLFKLHNGHMEVTLTNFGATITCINTPDKNGQVNNIVLGYPELKDYINDEFYTGCIIGRYAGRISNAQLAINGHNYPLAQNDGNHIHLHGGIKGFSKRLFTLTNETVTDDTVAIELHYRSANLEEGYPGNLDVWVTYELAADNRLTIKYKAITDSDTHVNLTNHSYFNLSGKKSTAINNRLFINADTYLETDQHHLPTGDIKPVKSTPYDFNTPQVIAGNLTELKAEGFNDCYILNKNNDLSAAGLSDDVSGRSITLETDMPALLFYSGDYLNHSFLKNNGVCLETQFFPDTPNHADFPSTLLKAGQVWESFTRFAFSWEG